jgi:trimeric autotransporter adhesin
MKLHVYPNRWGKHGRSVSSTTVAKKLFLSFANWFFAGLLLVYAHTATAQISGTVYRDFNASGTKDTYDVGVGGITVTIYSNSGTVVGTTTTSTATATLGNYNVTPSPNTGPFRVEFTNFPSGYFSGPRGSASGTTVQFVASSSSTINLGVNDPDQYCQDNPAVIVPCYVSGDPTKSGSAATDPAIVSFSYSASGIKGSGGTAVIGATNANLSGPTWGVAYDKFNNVLYSSAVVRRHSGFGPLGVGGIYKTTNPGSNTIATSSFVNLEASPYNIDFGTLTNAARNLPANKPDPSAAPLAFDAVGKQGIGDMDISEDGRMLYLINLFDRKLYRINNINTGTPPAAGDITSFNITDPSTVGCSNSSNFRPWALKFSNGKLIRRGGMLGRSVSWQYHSRPQGNYL